MKIKFLTILYIISALFCNAQDLITGDDFLSQASEYFTTISDYRAEIEIRDVLSGELKMRGTVIYKKPNLLRIDFSGGQVFVSNGERMLFYAPEYSFVLNQEIEHSNTDLSEIIKGLDYLENTYSASFVESPEMLPIDEDSEELVYKLNLFSSFARFREIELSINSNMMIRRMKTNTIIVDYKNIQINTNLLKQQFNYIPPSSATIIQDFLY